MSKIKLYFHTGSANHGCEAIVRGTKNILNSELMLFSQNPDQDEKFGINTIVEVEEDVDIPLKRRSIRYLLSALQIKLSGATTLNTFFRHTNFFGKVKKGDVCLSIGGDNYCYKGFGILGDYNKLLHKKGAKTVLWGCSINEDVVSKSVEDLSRYDMIVARESLTVDALKRYGVDTKIRLCSDPAFQMKPDEAELPDGFVANQTVGINLSPLIQTFANSSLIYKNYERVIDHIIDNTTWQIALIPHVVNETNNDCTALNPLFDRYKESGRIVILGDDNCRKLKAHISKCRFFIGARTHSTIAAYSTCVPTIAVGYSIKAKGIAKDIFGTFEKYVQPVQDFDSENALLDAFRWLVENERSVRDHYGNMMDSYRNKALEAANFLEEIS